MEQRGLKYAIDYLNSFHPVMLVPDELHKRAGITCKVDTLSRKLRRSTCREDEGNYHVTPKGRVVVIYDLDERGDKVAFYRGNPLYKAPERKKAAAKPTVILGMDTALPGSEETVFNTPAVFFFETLQVPGIFSPYYTDRQAMFSDTLVKGIEAVYYTGTHDNPVRL